MKFRIHSIDSEDSATIEGETLAECRDKASVVSQKRGWSGWY